MKAADRICVRACVKSGVNQTCGKTAVRFPHVFIVKEHRLTAGGQKGSLVGTVYGLSGRKKDSTLPQERIQRTMSKILIASDLHGSAYYCRKLLEAMEREGTQRMLLLGDILYHGPRNDLPREYAPKEVIAMLNPLKDRIVSVRGNCEAEVDQMVLNFPVLADYCLMPVGDHMMFCTHGHIYNEEHLPPMMPGDILLYGHTHVPRVEKSMGKWMLNPGSVSIPKGGSIQSYAVLEDGIFTVKDMDGASILQVDLL